MPREVGPKEIEAFLERTRRLTRRQVLMGAAGVAAAAALTKVVLAQAPPEPPADTTKVQGPLTSGQGKRSPFENPVRQPPGAQVSFTPLQDLDGIITPSDLHFERHHAGIPYIDPKRYKLLVHGMVDRPMVFSLADLKRYPSVSRFYFIECSGNSGAGFIRPLKKQTAYIHGLTSTSEWVGVPLATIFKEVGSAKQSKWSLFESQDAAVMTRSIPMEKLWDDALLAYGQNGEAIRPEQGYPVRLILPGYEGNAHVKWVRRIEIGDRPWQQREETSQYTDPVCEDGDCYARQFTFEMDAKSLITWPSGGQTVPGAGFWEIRGIAWSGRGFIEKVEVSTDGGKIWGLAKLELPVLPICHARFRYPWVWDGKETVIISRATDSTGHIQPTRDELIKTRGLVQGPGLTFAYHANYLQSWRVGADGKVTNGLA